MKKMKCSKEDYTADDLPQTKKELFFDCYKNQFWLIFKCGFICLIIALPVLLTMVMCDWYVISAIEGLEDKSAENVLAVTYFSNMTYGAFKAVLFTLFAVLFSGVARVMRQLLWNEPIFFGDDYKNGLKSDALRFCITALIISAIHYVLGLFNNSVVTYIIYGVFAAFVIPVALWFLLQSIYYKIGVFASLKNALIYYIKTFPVTVLLTACSILPFWLVINFISLIIAKYIVLIILIVFYVIPLVMVWISYASKTFDKYVNKEHYPSIYRKGMRAEEDDEEISRNENADK